MTEKYKVRKIGTGWGLFCLDQKDPIETSLFEGIIIEFARRKNLECDEEAEAELEENCENCKFYIEINTRTLESLKQSSELAKEWFKGINGACQRYPPSINIEKESDYLRNTFPLVKHKTWCGEWRSKSNKKKYIKTPYGPMEVIE